MTSPTAYRRFALIGGLALFAGLATWWLVERSTHADTAPTPAGSPAVQATLSRVLAQPVPIYKTGVGTVTATQSVTVRARIDGQLDRVAFVEGEDVKAGQLLAQIDPRTLQAQLAQTQAQRAKDAAQLSNARIDLQRFTTLIADDAATRQQLDTQTALVAQLEAALASDDAQIAFAQVQLGFTTISAPIAGRAGARLVDAGNIVRAADANGLVVINQIDPISVVFTLPDDAVPDIHRAQHSSHAPLAVVAYPRSGEQPLATGKLVLLNNQIDTTSGTVQLKASFANPAHLLWPGQYVNVRLVLGSRDKALTLTAGAVQRGPDGTYVYVVNDDLTVRQQPIVVVQIQDGLAVIGKGLGEGQRVVVGGQNKLRPGASVTETATANPSPARAAPGSGS